MTRADVARVIALYAAMFLGATALWIALFHTPLFAESVFFYRGLVLLSAAVAMVVLVMVVLWRTSYRRLIGIRDIALVAMFVGSFNVLLFTHLPVTADRSISVFMLAYLERTSRPLTSDEIESGIVEHYVIERQATEKRLLEQLVTGTLERRADGYVISEEGRRLVALYREIARVFRIDSPNLLP